MKLDIFWIKTLFFLFNDYISVFYLEHEPFTIMNYGSNLKLTDYDKTDLNPLSTSLERELTKIN
jgi:hypothetical protein